MKGFSFYYMEANLVCVLVFILLLIHNYFNIDRQEKQIKFDHALIAFILYFLTDCAWAAIVDGVLPAALISVVTFLIYLFMAATLYTWFGYVMAYEQVPNRTSRKNRVLTALPLIASSIALLINFIAAPRMLVSIDTLETQPWFSVYLLTVPAIYMVAILFYTVKRALSEDSPTERRKHLNIGVLPLLSTFGGLLQETILP